MDDDIDQLLDQNVQQEVNRKKYKYFTADYWKAFFMSIYSFLYLFFHSLIFPSEELRNRSQAENNSNDRSNDADRRNQNNQRRPNHFRYRSRGGG